MVDESAGSETGSSDESWIPALVPAFQALGNEYRLQLLVGVHRGQSRQELVSELSITESAVSNHWARLRKAGLGYTPPDDRQYAVTPLGEFFAVFLESFGPELGDAVDAIDDAEDAAVAEFENTLSGEAFEQAVEQRKWALVRDELDDALAETQRDLLSDT